MILLIAILWSLPKLTWLMTVMSVTILACFLGCSQFRSSLHRLGFSTSISSLLILKHGIHDFVLSSCCPFYLGVASFVFKFEPNFTRCRFHRVCSFLYLRIIVSHITMVHYATHNVIHMISQDSIHIIN